MDRFLDPVLNTASMCSNSINNLTYTLFFTFADITFCYPYISDIHTVYLSVQLYSDIISGCLRPDVTNQAVTNVSIQITSLVCLEEGAVNGVR